MTREKIKNHIMASVAGPSAVAHVSRIALDTMEPPVGNRAEFVCALAWDLGCLVEEGQDGGYVFMPDIIDILSWTRFCEVREEWEKSQRGEKKPCATVLSDGK
jgi:hypothetical protein